MTKYTIGYTHIKKAERMEKVKNIVGLLVIALVILITGFQAQI